MSPTFLRHGLADAQPSRRPAGRGGRCRNGSADRAGRDWLAHSRTQCGSWNDDVRRRRNLRPPPALRPAAVQLRPPSRDSCTPPPDMPKYRCVGSRGSTMIECSFGPSGVPSCALPIHVAVLRIVVEPGDRLPGVAAVLGAEQSLRRGAGVPDAGLARMAGREPEGVVDRAALSRPRRPWGRPAAAPPPSSCGRDRSSETSSAPDGRSWPRRAASCRRADRARGD